MTELTSLKAGGVIALRCLQMLCIAALITGAVWSSSDLLLLTVLVNSPVAPLSVLLMVYGVFGSLLTEASVRVLSRTGRREKNSVGNADGSPSD